MWHWRVERCSTVLSQSATLFQTLDDCILDAQREGFAGKLSADGGMFGQNSYRVEIAEDAAGEPKPDSG